MPTPADHPLLTAARDWFDAGFAVIPSHEDGGKRPFGPWKQYQAQRPTWAEIEGWLATGRFTGIGVLTGHASGNVEMVEIEGPTEAAAVAIGRVKAKADELGCADLMDRVFSGCISRSAGDGLHVFVRVADGPAKGDRRDQRRGRVRHRRPHARQEGAPRGRGVCVHRVQQPCAHRRHQQRRARPVARSVHCRTR
jgi:hypothetical protein